MRTYLLILMLIPTVCTAQTAVYFSGDASANFGRHLEWTGYSANISGSIKLIDKLYAGLATGVLQVKPFINHLSIPLSGRLTFFTSSDETKIAPFGMFEVGKLFYRDDAYGGVANQRMEGKLSFFTGVGFSLPSQKKLHPFFAIGYAGYNYSNNQIDQQNTVIFSRPYHYRRIAIKAGFMLPRTWQRKFKQ